MKEIKMNLTGYTRHTVDGCEIRAVTDLLQSGRPLTCGGKVSEFEQLFQYRMGHELQPVATSSNMMGMFLLLRALELPKGSKVAVSDITFLSTGNAVLLAGYGLSLMDCDKRTGMTLESEVHKALLNPEIRAVVVTDYAGAIFPYHRLSDTHHANPKPVIRDAAHSLGSSDSEMGGNCDIYVAATVYSLQGAKNITTGEGGMVATNDHPLRGRLLKGRDNGIERDPYLFQELSGNHGYEWQSVGLNGRMSDLAAVVGIEQLKKLPAIALGKSVVGDLYRDTLHELGLPSLAAPLLDYENREGTAWHFIPLRFDWASPDAREVFRKKLREGYNIGTQILYTPLSMQPMSGGVLPGKPDSHEFYRTMLGFPAIYNMGEEEVGYVCQSIKEVLEV